MGKRALLVANSASMIDHFNRDNIAILKDMGYDITVAANFKDGNSSTRERIRDFAYELADMGIEMINLPIPRKVTELGKTKKSINLLREYLAENPCRIIHTQTPFGGVVGRLAAKKLRRENKCKVIYFAHGFHFFKGASRKNFAIYYNIEKYLSKYTDCLITLNNEDYQLASSKFKKTHVEYVPGIGVDTEGIAEHKIDVKKKKIELGLPIGKKIILTVAELIPRKNVDAAIRIFSNLSDRECELVICGKGSRMQELRQLAYELNVGERVHFLGYRTDILDIYKIADLFLFTSYQEGLPVAVMQAMASRLPVVASDIRGNRDLLNPSFGPTPEYLIDVENESKFAEVVDRLLQDEELCQKIALENYTNCKNCFDISKVHEMMKNIYKSLDKQINPVE